MSRSKFIRPNHIYVCYEDPFDGKFLGSVKLTYQPRRAAEGFYSRYFLSIKNGLRDIESKVLNGRQPRMHIKFLS